MGWNSRVAARRISLFLDRELAGQGMTVARLGLMAWIVASAALAILTIAFGAPLLSVVALKPIAADLHTARAAPSAAGVREPSTTTSGSIYPRSDLGSC